jgi:hypothetical protein
LRSPRRGADADGEPAVLAVDQLALAGVDAGADVKAEVKHAFGDLLCASDRSCRTIEGGEKAVARGVVLDAAPATERLTHDCVVVKDQLLPVITELCLLLCGSDDVGEQHP